MMMKQIIHAKISSYHLDEDIEKFINNQVTFSLATFNLNLL